MVSSSSDSDMDRITRQRLGSLLRSDGIEPMVERGAGVSLIGEFDEETIPVSEGSLAVKDRSFEIFQGGRVSRHEVLSMSGFGCWLRGFGVSRVGLGARGALPSLTVVGLR